MTISEYKQKLDKSVDFLRNEMAQIRTGRASPSLLENIGVEAYGSKMTLKELGSITLLDNQNLSVSPWDKGLLQAIAKAIRESELQLNPIDESDRIRVPVPSLTEERRREFTKVVAIKVEECKNTMRNIRQDGLKEVERQFSEKKISEDDKFKQKEEYDRIIKEYTQRAEDIGEGKKKELMTV